MQNICLPPSKCQTIVETYFFTYTAAVSRIKTADCVILRVNRLGEINKSLTLFSRDFGLISAVAYGAWKGTGKLTGATDLLMLIKAFFYVDPVKDSWKLTDAQVKDDFSVLKTSLKAYYRASLCSEIIMRTHGGGDLGASLFELFIETLKELDTPDRDRLDYALIQFILRFIRMSGQMADPGTCQVCGRSLFPGASAVLDFHSAGFVCPGCSSLPGREGISVSPGALRYLAFTEHVSFGESLRVSADIPGRAELLRLCLVLAETAVGGPLKAAEAVAGYGRERDRVDSFRTAGLEP